MVAKGVWSSINFMHQNLFMMITCQILRVSLGSMYNFLPSCLYWFSVDIPHVDSHTRDSGSSHGKSPGDKSQSHTLTKFPRSDDSEDEDRTDVCFACCYFCILIS